jgi:AhpD family alkylhydroperoxidase
MTPENAVAGAAPLLRASLEQFGFVPSPVARAAHSPAYLKHLLAGFVAFERTSLAELEREVVALTVAFEVECHYCMAMHSALLSQLPEHAPILAALRAGAPLASPRLQALREFTRAIVVDRGRVPAAIHDALEREGFSREATLELLLGVGVYLLSTLGNVLMAAPLDPAFAAFAWQKPSRTPPIVAGAASDAAAP